MYLKKLSLDACYIYCAINCLACENIFHERNVAIENTNLKILMKFNMRNIKTRDIKCIILFIFIEKIPAFYNIKNVILHINMYK